MRIRILQLKKTAFAALIVLLLSVVGMKNAFAQDQIATLLHGNDLTVYYGADAFIEAYTIAETGDIITLSGGTFNGCDIDKAVTIHGAGPVYDSIMMTDPTKLVGHIHFSGGSDTEHIIIDGVHFDNTIYYNNVSFAEFNHCIIYSGFYSHDNSGSANNLRFTNCRIWTFKFDNATNIVFVNSVAYSNSHFNNQATEKNIIAYNSYISFWKDTSSSNNQPKCCVFTNCILCINDSASIPSSSCTLNNCICITNGKGSLLQYAIDYNCIEVETDGEVFISGWNTQYNPFILLDEIANSIVGTDGTQVGIYGGICPWTDRPNHMIMRRCTVGSRTTDDGHLSVDIEVVTEQ